jgi:hypothetical protein
MSDVIQELCDEFPEIERSSIEKICKTGLSGINKLMRLREELRIDLDEKEWIKFYIPASQEAQARITKENVGRRRLKATKQNGEKSK